MRRGKASVETIVRKRSLPDVYGASGVYASCVGIQLRKISRKD